MNRKIIKNALIMATMVLFVPMVAAQVTIGSTNPPNATLEVVATADTPIGIIAPRVTRDALHSTMTAIASPENDRRRHGELQNGAIVFVNCIEDGVHQTGDTSPTRLITDVGYYWFDYPYNVWRPFGGGAGVELAAPGLRISPVIVGQTITLTETQLANYDIFLVRNNVAGMGNISWPNLPANTPAGRMIQIVHIGTGLGILNTPGYEDNPSLGGGLGNNVGVSFLWIGDSWVRFSR